MVDSIKIDSNMVQLLIEDDSFSSDDVELNEAAASLSANPLVTWAKFILTDDEPNEKKERVPFEEFDNLIKSGVFMPIKMAESAIRDDHSDAEPLGVITHLQKVKNQVIGLAALWKREREDDVNMIKEKFDKNEPINLSWEIVYGSSKTNDEGVTDLLDTSLRAATIVGMPAYAGRTTFVAVASKEQEEILEELEKLQKEFDDLKTSYSSLETKLEEQASKFSVASTELEELRQYKADIEDAKEREAKINKIKEKFSSVDIKKEETYFVENAEMLLGLSEEALDFMVQELVSFASASNEQETNEDETNSSSIPNLTSPKPKKEIDPIALGQELRKSLMNTEDK